ncbi:MAG: tRNA pseudouridine(55) synthase TruB [Phycisphaerales bacterium]
MNVQPPLPPTGVLVIDKSGGYTSMDVCAIVRGKLRRGGAPKGIKVGHGGTLDPMATGVLVVLVGKATPLCNAIMAGEKVYEADIDLAHRSNTDDAEGLIEAVEIAAVPTLEALHAVLPRFIGKVMQVPPQYSALSVGGRRAYEIAREGGTVELAAREIEIRSIDVVAFEWPKLSVRVVCGKGVYIRSLARDLGAAVGCGGMLTALRRTRVGRFTLDGASRVQDLPDMLTEVALTPIPEELRKP